MNSDYYKLLFLIAALSDEGKTSISFDDIGRAICVPQEKSKVLLDQLVADEYVTCCNDRFSITSQGLGLVKSTLLAEAKVHWENLRKDNEMQLARSKSEKAEASIRKMIDQPRKIRKGTDMDNLFLIARRWNSYTATVPIITDFSRWAQCGGYFLAWNGKGIAIDPGYGFLRILNAYFSLGLKDIDAIIITHDHPDHTAAVEDILTLSYELNQSGEQHIIDFFANAGATFKFEHILSKLQDYFNLYVLRPNLSIDLNKKYGLTLKAQEAFHQELWSKKGYAIGLVLQLSDSFSIGITSDTKWDYRLISEYVGTNLLVLHLGSIEVRDAPLSNHLGSLGCQILLKYISPRLAIISEFGEELENFREDLIRFLRKSVPCCVFPGDIGLSIKLPSLDIRCSTCKDYHPFETMDYNEIHGEIKYKCQNCR